jgi:hypothetical protein
MFGSKVIVELTALIGYCTRAALTPDRRTRGMPDGMAPAWRFRRSELRHDRCAPN